MLKSDLLDKVLDGAMDNKLRGDIVRFLVNEPGKTTVGIPQLSKRIDKFSYADIFERMKSVAGGTASDVARVLNISSQGVSNQKQRGMISFKSILTFCLKTGVSVDWIIGAWDGVSLEGYDHIPVVNTGFGTKSIDTSQKFLSLVEVYDQHTGDVELKWCLTKVCGGEDCNKLPLPENYSVLLSLITRYKAEAGTPDKVKGGRRRHFQIRRVFAYVLGDETKVKALDHKAKSKTLSYLSDKGDRPGKTEFRVMSSKDDCLGVLKNLAAEAGLNVCTPAVDTIAWDYLIGDKSLTPLKWVQEKMENFKKKEQL
jgi:hypothetical protein